MSMISINIPAIAAVEAQEALKGAAWEIAKKIARADSFAGHEFFGHLAMTAEARAAEIARINGLINAAAVLDGDVAPREGWDVESMISECALDIEAAGRDA